MPVNVKIVFSLVVLAVAGAGYFFLDWFGGGTGLARYLALFLGLFSVVSFWIFPEVANTKKSPNKSQAATDPYNPTGPGVTKNGT